MSNVSLERYYFVLYDGALTLKYDEKMALNAFCDKTLHINNLYCLCKRIIFFWVRISSSRNYDCYDDYALHHYPDFTK